MGLRHEDSLLGVRTFHGEEFWTIILLAALRSALDRELFDYVPSARLTVLNCWSMSVGKMVTDCLRTTV